MSANDSFEAQYYDEYDYYNLDDATHCGNTSRKGRSKAESSSRSNPNTNVWKTFGKLETENSNRTRKNAQKNQS